MLNNLLRFLPVLACGGFMYVCMRAMGGHREPRRLGEASTDAMKLKAEVARLRAELEETKKAERVDD